MEDIKGQFGIKEYVMRENFFFHAPIRDEFEFYKYVMNGDTKKVKLLLKEDFCSKTGLGVLSQNKLRNFKYHFVVTAALLSRYCIDGGMEHEMAYTLSDLYIGQADEALSLNELSDLHRKMTLDYTERMNKIINSKAVSKHVVECINYIYDHLHERITVEMLADYVGISESYLSRSFKKEIGLTIGDYISKKKTETARNMIDYSDYSLAEISNILAFTSQSYFVKIFKQNEGMTPGQYKIKVRGDNMNKKR